MFLLSNLFYDIKFLLLSNQLLFDKKSREKSFAKEKVFLKQTEKLADKTVDCQQIIEQGHSLDRRVCKPEIVDPSWYLYFHIVLDKNQSPNV